MGQEMEKSHYTASILAEADFLPLCHDRQMRDDLIGQAEEILLDAQSQAAQIIKDAQDEVDLLKADARNALQPELDAWFNQEQLDISAAILVDLEYMMSGVNDAFSKSETFINDTIMGCVEKILGTIEWEELHYKLIDTCIRDLRQDWTLTLWASPEMARRLSPIMPKLQKKFRSIRELKSDQDLNGDTIRIETPGGLVDASLEAQVAVLQRAIAQS